MPDSDFGSLVERLLRAGIAPVHARRLVAELETHYASLVEEELARGEPLATARSMARIRLGADDDIVGKACEQSALRSWGARWPLSVCGVAPALGLLATCALLVAALAIAFFAKGPPSAPAPWVRNGTMLLGWLMLYGLPLMWAGMLVRYSISRRLGWRWSVTGLFLVAASGALTNFSVTWPGPGTRGALSAGLGWTMQSGVSLGIRCLVTAVLGLAVYWLMRDRLERHTTG